MRKEENDNIPSSSSNSKIKPPSSLKRPLSPVEDVSKIPKSGQNSLTRSQSQIVKANLRNTTFTVPNKKVINPIEKVPIRPMTTRSGIQSTNTTLTGKGLAPKGRPTWDLRGKMAELETACNERIANADKKIEELVEECAKLTDDIKVRSETISELEGEKNRLNTNNHELKNSIDKLSESLENLQAEIQSSKDENSNLSQMNENLKKSKLELESTINSQNYRIQKLEESITQGNSELSEFKTKYDKSLQEIDKNKKEIELLKESLIEKDNEYNEVNKKYYELKKNAFELNLELDSKNSNLEILKCHYEAALKKSEDESKNIEKYNYQLSSLKSEKENLCENLNKDEKRISELVNEIERLKSKLSSDSSTISQFQQQICELTFSRESLQSNLGTTGSELIALRKELELCKKQLGQADIDRRLMHHKFMELRGTIRVCCRARPLLSPELQSSYLLDIDTFNDTLVIQSSISRETVIGDKADSNRYEFSFDRIFGQNSSQSEVFDEIDPLIQSALDGYSVCIFAYGQTGSGKTYTMEGDLTDPEKVGIIQRSVSKIFDSMQTLSSKGWSYKVEVSFLEIYNETLRDLLVKDPSKSSNKLDIKTIPTDSKTGAEVDLSVTDLTTILVTNLHDVKKLLQTANKNRSVASTKCNMQSSRSHSVFRLRITGTNANLNDSTEAIVNLVDLAGSERLSQSGAENERLKETQHINKSLSTLKTVIIALTNKENHVPFRDSKLTRLLQSSLGGNCKTLMFVNISPNEESFSESLNSLRFASNVNKCHIGAATKKKASK